MTMKAIYRTVPLLFLLTACVTTKEKFACDADCEKVKHGVAVMGATLEGCAKSFPEHAEYLNSAFKNWNVLKLKIPGIQDLLSEKTPELKLARKEVESDFHSPKFEQEIQCGGYAKKLKEQYEFFPKSMLDPYR